MNRKQSRKALKRTIKAFKKLYKEGAGISNIEFTQEIVEDPLAEYWKEYMRTGNTSYTIGIYNPKTDDRPSKHK